MTSKNVLKESFAVDTKAGAFFTGGKISWSEDGCTLYCQNSGVINVVDVDNGLVKLVLGDPSAENPDLIYSFCASQGGSQLVSSHKSGLLKLWDTTDGKLVKQWRSIHMGPVVQLDLRQDGSQLASGGSDAVVRIWDLCHQACTHSLKGAQGVISVVQFCGDLVFGCGDVDLKISCWDLKSHNLVYQLAGHYSKVTAISFHHEGKHLVSSSRDRVLILWDLTNQKQVKTIPVYESVESVICLPHKFELPTREVVGGIYVASAGEKGTIQVYNMPEAKVVYTQENPLVSRADTDGGLSVTQLLFNTVKNQFAVVTADHCIILHQLETFHCVKQLVGFSDEILDLVYIGADNSHLAVATNSRDIKLYNMAHMGCQLMKGHTDLVLCLAACLADNSLLLSGAKDNTVRLWQLDDTTQMVSCLVVGSRHTASVSSVSFSQLSAGFFVSASQDTTLKVWHVKSLATKQTQISVKSTEVAHEKEINCACISPNDKMAATGSQDKTIKLWALPNLALVGVLRGHRRGVWAVRFSPVDQVLLSTSADTTLKLWSVTNNSCLKTFEGHSSSVLRAEFISSGMQVVSTSGDGLLKLWSVKTGECVATCDEHSGRVWSLAVSKHEDRMVTGGSDSTLVVWRDSTQENRTAAAEQRERGLQMQQRLSNLLNSNQLLAALSLALELDRPFQVLNIVRDLAKMDESTGLALAVKKLTDSEKEKLLKCSSTWNTNAKHSDSAQLVVSVLLDELASGHFQTSNLSSYLEELLPYTERHFTRLTGLVKDIHFLRYTMTAMKPAVQNLKADL